MNREIKFRGKRVDNGEWVYGFYVQWEDHCNELKHLIFVKSNEDKEFSHMEQYEVIPETVGQFTGLLDKNGKEIYEGDILKVTYEIYCESTYHEVKYGIDEDYPAFELYPCLDYAESNSLQYLKLSDGIYKFEVIGNIHDNPELLK